MTDVATLGVTATETGVSKVDKALMGLAASAGKADVATGRFSSAQIKYAQSAMAGWDGFNTVVAKQPALVKAAGVQMQNYGSHTANVFSQLNDIAVMLAAGQNPIQLAMQQGMQLNQVWGQMGGKVGAVGTVLRGAFMSLLNPLNLVTIGVIAGGAALVNYFTSGSEKAKSFEDTLSDLSDATQAVRDVTWQSTDSMIAKYGQLTESIMGAIAAQQQFALDSQMMAANDAVAALKTLTDEGVASIVNMQQQIEVLRQQPIIDDSRILDLTENMNYLAGEMGLTVTQAVNLNSALQDYSGAKGLVDKAAAATAVRVALEGTSLAGGEMARSINQSELALYEAVSAAQKLWAETKIAEAAAKALSIAAPNGSWMEGAIGSVGVLTGKLWAAFGAMSALKAGGTTSSLSQQYAQYGAGRASAEGMIGAGVGGASDTRSKWMNDLGFGGGSSGGGGGGGTDPYQANLDRLVASLMTERETVEKWYADNEVILNDRRAMELLGASAHKEAMLDLERQYHEKLSKIKDDSDAYNLGSTAKLFGDLNTMAGGGYDGLLRAQKAFAAAEALVNTYRAASQALADPKLSTFAKFVAVAKVIATGMGLVNAIKGGGKAGAGGSSGSSAQTTAASSQPVADRVTTVSFAGDPFMVAIAESVMKQMYDASGNGRVLIKA